MAPTSTAMTILLLPVAICSSTHAAETLRVGKAVPEAFSFTPVDVGIREDIFGKNGIHF